MRFFIAVALIILVCELILAAAFLAGYFWLGGWGPGLLLLGGVLLLLILPWIGEAAVEYDSAAGQATVRLGWWGGLTFRQRPETEVRGRFFLIPWRSKKPSKPKPEPTEDSVGVQRPRRAWRLPRFSLFRAINAKQLLGLLLALGQTAHELFWGARYFSIDVEAPTQNQLADSALRNLVGCRTWGPLEFQLGDSGARRVRVRYRIALVLAAVAGLRVLVEGRPRAVVKSLRVAQHTSAVERVTSTPEEDE